jgi:hypothetical protein
MKKTLWMILCVSLLLASADTVKLVRLTLVNKSGYDMSIWLNGVDEEEFYYLALPLGTRAYPVVKVYTIVADTYKMQVAYTKAWDPVYPEIFCQQHPPTSLIAKRNIRLIFTDCAVRPPNAGEPSMMKFWSVFNKFFDRKFRYIY